MSIATQISALQADKTAIATAITNKGGTVASGDGFDDFATDIGTIPSGGSSEITLVKDGTEIVLTGVTFTPTTVNYSIVNYGGRSLSSIFENTTVDKVNITLDAAVQTVSNYMFMNSTVKEVNFNIPTSAVSVTQIFKGCTNLETVTGINFSSTASAAWQNSFYYCTALKNITFVADTISAAITFNRSPLLTDASLVSIANGLNPSSVSTVTFHATPKAKLSTIMGTVTDGVFTADASGTTSLQTFITDTKGWTIA